MCSRAWARCLLLVFLALDSPLSALATSRGFAHTERLKRAPLLKNLLTAKFTSPAASENASQAPPVSLTADSPSSSSSSTSSSSSSSSSTSSSSSSSTSSSTSTPTMPSGTAVPVIVCGVLSLLLVVAWTVARAHLDSQSLGLDSAEYRNEPSRRVWMWAKEACVVLLVQFLAILPLYIFAEQSGMDPISAFVLSDAFAASITLSSYSILLRNELPVSSTTGLVILAFSTKVIGETLLFTALQLLLTTIVGLSFSAMNVLFVLPVLVFGIFYTGAFFEQLAFRVSKPNTATPQVKFVPSASTSKSSKRLEKLKQFASMLIPESTAGLGKWDSGAVFLAFLVSGISVVVLAMQIAPNIAAIQTDGSFIPKVPALAATVVMAVLCTLDLGATMKRLTEVKNGSPFMPWFDPIGMIIQWLSQPRKLIGEVPSA